MKIWKCLILLVENLEILKNTRFELSRNYGFITEKVDKKLKNVLEKNTELKSMFMVRNILNGDLPNITSGEVTTFKYAK
jgi:hypothetical protein